jgi:hypothetical protein
MAICQRCRRSFESSGFSSICLSCERSEESTYFTNFHSERPLLKNPWFITILFLIALIAVLTYFGKPLSAMVACQILLLVAIIWNICWSYFDAESRGKPGCLVALLVGLTWPIGLLIWLIIRV